MGVVDDVRGMSSADIAKVSGIRHVPVSPATIASGELDDWRDAILNAWEDGQLYAGQPYWEDTAREIVTGAVTSDTERQWEIFTELRLWGELGAPDVFEIITRDHEDQHGRRTPSSRVIEAHMFTEGSLAGVVLGVIAERAGAELVRILRDGTPEDE